FSSRRRHTRFSRDWSSDVCSSDLEAWDWARSLEVTAFITPVREGYCPLKIEVRVGLHVGIDHVLRKRTPAFAMASMLTVSAGGDSSPPYPKARSTSTPTSSIVMKRMFGGFRSGSVFLASGSLEEHPLPTTTAAATRPRRAGPRTGPRTMERRRTESKTEPSRFIMVFAMQSCAAPIAGAHVGPSHRASTGRIGGVPLSSNVSSLVTGRRTRHRAPASIKGVTLRRPHDRMNLALDESLLRVGVTATRHPAPAPPRIPQAPPPLLSPLVHHPSKKRPIGLFFGAPSHSHGTIEQEGHDTARRAAPGDTRAT